MNEDNEWNDPKSLTEPDSESVYDYMPGMILLVLAGAFGVLGLFLPVDMTYWAITGVFVVSGAALKIAEEVGL